MSAQYTQELTQVLLRVTSARSTEEIKSASSELQKQWYQNKDTVVSLIQILQSHPQSEIRQLSAVEVRKLLPKFWYNSRDPLDSTIMEEIKASLLQNSLKEDNELVRHSVARVVSTIASIDVDENRWPALLPELCRAAQNGDARERETATYVLYALLETDFCQSAADQSSLIFNVLKSTIDDKDSLMTRVNSVHALVGLSAQLVGEDAKVFQPVVPKIVMVLKQCVDQSDDKSAIEIFEGLGELLDADAQILGVFVKDLLLHMLNDYGLNNQVEPDLRCAAIRVVATMASYRAHRIKKLQLGPELTTKLVEILASTEDEDEEDDEDDDDEGKPGVLAQRVLQSLAANLPPSMVIAPLLQMLPGLIQGPTVRHQSAAYLAFTATAEEAPELVNSEVDTLLPWVTNGLKSNHQPVRLAALQALVCLGDISPESVGKEHATFIPLVYNMLDSAPSMRVCRMACSALEVLMRSVNGSTFSKEYLPGLVPRLLEVISTNTNMELKGYVINTIGTAAEVTGRNYAPYFDQTIKILEPYVSIPNSNIQLDAEAAKIVSNSLGALSSLCSAVGADMFMPYLDHWVKTVVICLQSEDSNLKELAPLYINDIAEVYGEKFAPYTSVIVPLLFNILNSEEITFTPIDEQDDDADITDGLNVNSALLLEKEYSLDCLGGLWGSVPVNSMLPYQQDSLMVFKENIDHYYDEVRSSAIIGLWKMYERIMSDEIKTIVWESMKEVFEGEVMMEVIERSFEVIADACEKIGAQAFPTHETVELLLNNIYKVVNKTHRVYEPDEDEENEEQLGEESSETTVRLIESAFNLLAKVATALSADFAPLFPKVAELIQPYLTSQVDSDRANAICCIADLVAALKTNITPYTEGTIGPLMHALSDSADNVRSYSAYGLGVLVEFTTNNDAVKPHYAQAFPLLGQIVSSSKVGRTKANALGAMARLALKNPDALPVSQADIVRLMIQELPLNDGYEEYAPILQFLASCQLPVEAKPVVEKLWKQHEDALNLNAVKSVTYLPADDPLGDEKTMAAWDAIRQKF